MRINHKNASVGMIVSLDKLPYKLMKIVMITTWGIRLHPMRMDLKQEEDWGRTFSPEEFNKCGYVDVKGMRRKYD